MGRLRSKAKSVLKNAAVSNDPAILAWLIKKNINAEKAAETLLDIIENAEDPTDRLNAAKAAYNIGVSNDADDEEKDLESEIIHGGL